MKPVTDIAQTAQGAAKAFIFLVAVVLLIPVALIYKRVREPFTVPCLFHRFLLWLLGIKIRVHGQPSPEKPVLFVSNHASYLDIPVLGAVLPAAFVAKSEVARWPLFGFLSKIQNTVFVERRSTRAAAQRAQLQEHLAKRQNLILFPEGTSSDGLAILPFKSTLFSIVEDAALDAPITVQPVSVTATALNGHSLSPKDRDLYAWYGDMTLPPHLWEVFKRGHFTVDVVFHPPVPSVTCANRKELAATCQALVAQGVAQSLASI